MNRLSFSFRAFIALASFVLLLPVIPVRALSVNPAIQDIVLDPGKVETRTITVENDETVTQTYVISIQKFIPKGELGQQEFLDARDTSGLPEWMYVDKPEITLAPGQSGTIQVAVRPPADAQPGGHYAALFLSRKQSSQEQVAMLPRLGILFFVQMNGALTEKLSLQKFETDFVGTYGHLPVGFRTTILNEGNVHVVPNGEIRVKNMFGATVALVPVNPETARVMPGSNRIVASSWSKGKPMPSTGFVQGLMQELMHFGIGSYTATLTMEGRGFTQPVERSVSFVVWPWRTTVALGAFVILLVALFFAFKKLAIASATAKTKSKE